MAHILYNGIKFHWNFKLLAPKFRAITLFGHIFTRMSKPELEEYLKTYVFKPFRLVILDKSVFDMHKVLVICREMR